MAILIALIKPYNIWSFLFRHSKNALGQLVPSIIENLAPWVTPAKRVSGSSPVSL